jgi:hypothetical protein
MKRKTEELLYEKWIDTPRLLKDHLQPLADKGDELAIQGLEKVKEWEDNLSDDLPGTTGDTYPVIGLTNHQNKGGPS